MERLLESSWEPLGGSGSTLGGAWGLDRVGKADRIGAFGRARAQEGAWEPVQRAPWAQNKFHKFLQPLHDPKLRAEIFE